MVDSPISFLSQKLEKLPISDYLFISRSLTPTSKDDLNFREDDVKKRKNCVPGRNNDNYDNEDAIVGRRKNNVSAGESDNNCRLWSSSSIENNIVCIHNDNGVVKTAELNDYEKTNNDEIQINKEKLDGKFPRIIRRPFSVAKTKPTTTTTIKKSYKFDSSSSSSFSPTFSKSLPTTSSSAKVVDNDNYRVTAQLRRSPSKRKHSEVMETTNLLSYNYEETSSFTRSCDFEVFDICKRDFRNIQRALSFDDDLLRSNDNTENIQKQNGAGNTTKMASSYSPLLMPRHRRQNRPTSKSQPSFSRMTSSLEKPRKFKIISPSDELLVSDKNKALLKNHKVVSANGASEPQPPLKSVGSLFSTTISNITTPRADEFYSIGKYWTVDL